MRMPEVLIPPTLAVVVLGLLASLGWGISDFGGGLASRGAPVLGVLLWSQLSSLAIGVPAFALSTEPAMRDLDIAIALVGGALAGSGLALLYRGLSEGRMGVVAPVAAVITAGLPVVFGFLTEGMPSYLAIAGIGFAVLAVVLVSRAPTHDNTRPTGILYAVGAGLLFGSFTVSASLLADDLIVAPVVVIRIASIATVATLIVVLRQSWRVPRRLLPALFGIGIVDMAASGSYLAALTVGPLAIASILASLYPVITTVLAAVVLRERVTKGHAFGIAAAGAAVALIAGAAPV